MDEQQKDERETPISSYDLPAAFSQIRNANEDWDDQVEWDILQDIVSGGLFLTAVIELNITHFLPQG